MSDQTGTDERYEIRITGHLASRWAAIFEGLTLTQHDDGTTVSGRPDRRPVRPPRTAAPAG